MKINTKYIIKLIWPILQIILDNVFCSNYLKLFLFALTKIYYYNNISKINWLNSKYPFS